ncbi:MAG: hypothetical protein GC179_00510 [Anaerolineaceae bacterium]|nr:hypothetical protein [Anaerolineaceae bacterium]
MTIMGYQVVLPEISKKCWRISLILVMCFLVLVSVLKLDAQNSTHSRLPYAALQTANCTQPANAIVAENCLPGTDVWKQIDYSPMIEVFASETSVNAGSNIGFYVASQTEKFDLSIYRIGYYGGAGARLIKTIPNIVGGKQPNCNNVEDTGLRTCSNWGLSYSLDIPADWISGVYLAQVVQSTNGLGNETVFTVRQDDSKAAILYQSSVTTFQAYNNYGGKSVYSVSSGTCNTVADAPRAVKVSLNRPYSASIHDPNYFFRAEYPMVRWLEEQGYDVTYSTSMDTHRSGKPGEKNALLAHKVFLSVGHDEYWSQEMRDAVTAARDAGVNIGFFSANTSYWRVRFESDPVTQEPDSVMVTYKTTESGKDDPSGHPTGTWRDPKGANNPENALLGVMYIGDNDKMYFPLRLSSEYTSDRLYRHTGLQNLPADSYIDVGDQIVGWEWDSTADNDFSPQGLQVITNTPVYGFMVRDAGRFTNGDVGEGSATSVRYIAPSGAIVFASGTIQWSWGLGAHGLEVVPPDPYITQMTYNILSDMGVQPTTPAANLILDGSDTPDPVIPTDKIKYVSERKAPVISNVQVTIDGTNATVTWTTDVDSTGQVWYGLEPDHIISPAAIDTDYAQNHSLVVSGLLPGTTYYVKVASVSRESEPSISDESSFTLPTGSFTQQIQNAITPLVKQGSCWVRANQTGAIFLVILGVLITALLVTPLVILRRRARLNAKPV